MRFKGQLFFCLFLFLALSVFSLTRIGITAITDHPALDAIRFGIIDGLIQEGWFSVRISNLSFNRRKAT